MDPENVILSGKSDREGKVFYNIPYMWNLKRNYTNKVICKTKTDLQNKVIIVRGKDWGEK